MDFRSSVSGLCSAAVVSVVAHLAGCLPAWREAIPGPATYVHAPWACLNQGSSEKVPTEGTERYRTRPAVRDRHPVTEAREAGSADVPPPRSFLGSLPCPGLYHVLSGWFQQKEPVVILSPGTLRPFEPMWDF